ncbi:MULTISPECIES: tetratricopeptide repeat protein [Methanocalculus]|uniref:tetratricopeptide repeat protein n=1 Tax=Methanocalculus TaxID=71151 RepID=UPI0031B635D5
MIKRGEIALNTGKYEEVLHIYTEILKKRPDHAGFWMKHAATLTCLKRDQEALESFDRSIQIHPLDAAAWIGRGVLLHEMGRSGEAAASIAKAEEIDQHHPALRTARERLRKPKDSPDSAPKTDPDLRNSKREYLLWCDSLKQARRFDEALRAADEGRKRWPWDLNFQNVMGAALVELKRPAEALPLLEQNLSIDPESGYTWHFHGRALMDSHQYVKALESFDAALSHNPENANTWFYRSIVLHTLGLVEEAETSMKEAARLDPVNIGLTASRYLAVFSDLLRRT